MPAWTPPIAVDGALADVLVDDFGGSTVSASLPRDQRLCITVDYAAAAAGQLQLWLATGAGVAAEDRIMLYDSAFQTNPGANQTQYVTGLVVSVPIDTSTMTPYQLRITKGNFNANVWIAAAWSMGPF